MIKEATSEGYSQGAANPFVNRDPRRNQFLVKRRQVEVKDEYLAKKKRAVSPAGDSSKENVDVDEELASGV